MAKETNTPQQTRDNVISIIGPGMRVIGDCETDGTLRVEGTVEGTVRAGKAVVIGKDGVVMGDVITQDAIIGGRVTGAVVAESRLELQATCAVEGKIKARRIKLDEGGRINGTVFTGDISEGDMNSDIARPKGSARAAVDTPEDTPAASA